MNGNGLWMAAVIAALSEGFLHYFPWRLVFGGRDLPRPIAYVLGVLGFAVPFVGWAWWVGDVASALAFGAIVCAAGATVVGLYAFDWVLNALQERRESLQREQFLKAVVDEQSQRAQ